MNHQRGDSPPRGRDLFSTLARALLLAAGLVVLLWFLYQIQRVLLLFVFALILALAINAPVTWLEHRRIPRPLAMAGVVLSVAGLIAFLGWLVVPRLIEQVPTLLDELPELIERLAERLAVLLGDHPEIERQLSNVVEWLMEAVAGVWQHADVLLGAFVFLLFVIALVLYIVANPRPMLRVYIAAMPPHLREPAARAFARGSQMVVGWIVSNLILGGMKAVALFVFLTYMQIPAPIVWSLIALFAALIPRVGFYLMSIPPVVVALSVDPLTALWVGLYVWILSEILGNFVAPRVQGRAMDLDPVYLLMMTLALAFAFGLVGVLIASPVAGFLKAYFDEFYLARQPLDPHLEQRVDAMMNRAPELTAEVEPVPTVQPIRVRREGR